MNNRFKPALTMILAAMLTFSLASCSNEEDFASAYGTSNTLLTYIPEDAPYMAGNLEPIPEDFLVSMFLRLEPALTAVQADLEYALADLELNADIDDSSHALALAVLNELDGNLNAEGLRSLGFTMKPQQVIYGMGMFPVIRVSLADAQALRDTIARIELNSGVGFPEHEHQGQSYWKLSDDGGSRDGFNGGVYLAIIQKGSDAHLAFSVFPTQSEAELLPAFLGQKMPATDTAAMRLAEINQDYNFTPYGTGIFDFQLAFDQLTDPNSTLRRSLEQAGEDEFEQISSVCQAEIESIIAYAPRMIAGTTEMTQSAVGAEYRLELESNLATELAGLVANVPPVPTQTERLLELAFGIRIGAARDFMTTKLTEMSLAQFECEHLRDINSWASDTLVKLNYPMPPLVNNLFGMRASLDQMPEHQGDISSARGSFAIHMDKPEMVLGMAKMFLPAMENVEIEKGGPPVELPQSVLPVPGVTAYAAMSDSALGIALGQDETAGLSAYLAEESEGTGSFFSVNYDMATYMERMNILTDDLIDAGVMRQDYDSDMALEHHSEVQEAFQNALTEMADRNLLEFRFDDRGLAIENRMQFRD